MSFSVVGMPSAADSGSPARHRFSEAPAASIAPLRSIMVKALKSGLIASARSSAASVTSTGDSDPAR
nr:hypothetical protein [Mesorhizobium sp. M7A.F.Ca.MR.362.00.0.0]